MMGKLVLYELRDGIAFITINRPDRRNALNGLGMVEMGEHWLRFKNDPEARVAVLTGAGDKAFCAGADLKDIADDEENLTKRAEKLGRMAGTGHHPRELKLGKPVIAALNGYALGAGGVLALQCDLRVASINASIGFPPVKLGHLPSYLFDMWRMMPPAVALKSLYTGDPVKAEDLYRTGMVSDLVTPDELMPTATALAEKVRDNPPLVMRAIKEVWDSDPEFHKIEWIRIYTDVARMVSGSEDFKEGPRAFAEKRKPVWRGK